MPVSTARASRLLGVWSSLASSSTLPEGEDLMQRRSPVAEVEPLECLCRGRAGQGDFAPSPLYQPFLHQVSYEPGDGLPLEAKLRLEGAGVHRLFGSGDEDERSDVVLAERHSL